MMYQSEKFKIDADVLLKRLAVSWLSFYWWLLLIPLLLITIWSCYDLRAIYVGLILLFTVFPFALCIVWFNYALTPNNRKQLTYKKLIVSDDGLLALYYKDKDSDDIFASDKYLIHDLKSIEEDRIYNYIITGDKIDEMIIAPSDIFEPAVWNKIKSGIAVEDVL